MSGERLARIQMLIGNAGVAKLKHSHVAVIGLGAVGSYAAEAIARAGVGRIRLVDFDTVHASNINRQLYALSSTIGKAKADLAARRVTDINPDCHVEAIREFVHIDTMDKVLADPPDIVIDAIDSLQPKVELLSAIIERKIAAVACMGAALRTDPSLIRTGPLGDVKNCPLSRRLRKRLRRRKLPLDVHCVYSIESVPSSADETGQDHMEKDEDRTSSRGRLRRKLGSLPTLTGIFGLTAANETIRMLLGGTFRHMEAK